MTSERLDRIDRLTRAADAHGYRSECIELVAEVKTLRGVNDVMKKLLRRLVANQDTQCRLDRHGYCQEHNYADPCPVPEAQRLTGSGTEYVSTKGTRF